MNPHNQFGKSLTLEIGVFGDFCSLTSLSELNQDLRGVVQERMIVKNLGQLSPSQIKNNISNDNLISNSGENYFLEEKTYSIESRFNESGISITGYIITKK